jgi:hypothetical protein
MTKKFKFSVKTKSGKVLHESIVAFGGKNHPFPENWKEDYWVQMGIQDTKQRIFEEKFSIEVSEDLTFTIEENQIEKDKIRFAIEQLKNHIEHPKLGYKRHDILVKIKELEQQLKELENEK